jgi:pimeloyl-ACP methyl ester carboxylesterase
LILGALVTLLTVGVPGHAAVAAGPSIVSLRAAGAAQIRDVFVRPPAAIPDDRPLQVVIALHGMGGRGVDFANALTGQADRYGWLLVAPTVDYGDWTDPNQIAHEDPALSAWLSEQIQSLVDNAEYPLQPQVLMFGHSRGAQLALRFAELHPDQVAGVAAVSAGTYTLPLTSDSRSGRALAFPFGVANLAQDSGGRTFNAHEFREVPIWIGVGAEDNNPSDVPDAWDPYIGDDRRERAERFAATLGDMGVDVTLSVFAGASHGLTDDMRSAGCAALAEATL